ncbi:telomere length regulation protein TEL2 homolog isoform X3 [Daphnia magna]|uniref:telomere length regulation protein TEL2 homolog isoform X3 n=1 Tax=Daphnia magna TaxID=35525 RepID=UPI001E1BD23B|nr:telomere length regulation protein TEL2 homolog isoform X3 [Daphnia magna]
MLGLWKVREIADKVTNVVMNYTEIEAKVREATNDEAWGPTGQLMQEVAQATFTYEQFPEVMGMLWKRMLGERKNWRRTYKSLLLLNYLIKNGSERVVTSAREHLYDLRGLENYTCVDEQGKDQGVNIRHKVKEMVDFIQDDDKLREERKKAKKNKDKYVGMSNDTLGMGMGYRGGGGGGGGASGGSWEEAPRRRNDDFSDWDSNRGNGSSRRKNDDDNSSDISADEATDRRDISSGIESKPSGRFGGEFRDSDEPIKRQDKEFKFDIDKSKSTSAKSTKKIDLGAAAFYKVEPTPATAPNPVTQSTNDNGSSDLLADVFGNPGNATTTTSSAAASILDDFDPRGVDSGANGDFGDFSSAFSSQAAPQASASDSFANFGAVFDSTITAAPQAATPSQDAFLLDDLLAPAPAEPSSSPFHAFSTNVMPQDEDIWKIQVGHLVKMLASRKLRTDCRKSVIQLARFLPGPPTPQKLSRLDTLSEECRQFTSNHYRPILEAMLTVDPEDEMVFGWMETGPAEETLHVLIESIKDLMPSKRRDSLVLLVTHLVTSDAFLFSCIAPSFDLTDRWQWEEDWVKPVASLPDVLGNVLQRYLPLQLAPAAYHRSLAVQLARCLFILTEAMKHSISVKVEPLAVLVTSLCAKAAPNYLLEPLIKLINSLTRNNFIARRLWSALMRSLDDRCLEQVVTYLSKWSESPATFKRLLGVSQFPLEDRWQRLLCSKLLLLRGLTCPRVGRNILTFLADDSETLLKVTITLLSLWSEKNALLLTSPEQHEFITKCLVIAFNFLPPEQLTTQRVELHRMLREGVNHHLESPQVAVRILGMFVAEVCTRRIHPEGPTLEFNYDKSEPSVMELQNLLSPQEEKECEIEDFETVLGKTQEVGNAHNYRSPKQPPAPIVKPTSDSKEIEEPASEEALDSDDDLEPYDMSEDTVESKFEAPCYIRDLMDMLGNSQSETEEYEKLILALEVSEEIIRQQLPREHPSLAGQLLAVLIHLQDKFSIPDFVGLRRRAMIAVCVSQPIDSAQFLTGEFYQTNYSVVQRLDMLHVISATVQELSWRPDSNSSCIGNEISEKKVVPDSQDWRLIVSRRIESNTRRFSSNDRRMPLKYQNSFSSLAGHFFFPLAEKLDRCLVHLSLMDQDFVLLSSLIRTLTTILHCTGPVPLTERMARTLVDMIWFLRLHREPSVREASLTAFIQCLLSVSNHQLMANHALEIVDWKDWLVEAMEQDPSTQVRSLAQNALSLLAHLLNT